MSIPKSFTDKELLEACVSGDRKAQFQLHKKYYGLLLSICMRYAKCREDAEEVLNESFFKIFRDACKFNETGSIKAWMSKITLYTAIDHARKNNKYRKVFLPGIIPDQPINNMALANLGREELLQLIQRLPDSSRTVFSLYVIEGFPHKEIAGLLKISIGTSKWHLNNARKLLQTALGTKKRKNL